MYHNGVSHAVVLSDLEGILKIMKWISYLPPTTISSIPAIMQKDDLARLVKTLPTKSAYNPRRILDPEGGGGLFDKNSFDEIMSGWAKTIIVGRALLRGLPVGVIAVETRTVDLEIPGR